MAAIRGQYLLALSKYRVAILDLRDAGLLMGEAMANERLGKYHLDYNDNVSLATSFLAEAIRLYEKWGAVAKVSHLRSELQSKNGIVL